MIAKHGHELSMEVLNDMKVALVLQCLYFSAHHHATASSRHSRLQLWEIGLWFLSCFTVMQGVAS